MEVETMNAIAPTKPPVIDRDYATKKGVALFSRDIEDVERIRAHYDLDSFSQALRRAIKLAVTVIEDESAA